MSISKETLAAAVAALREHFAKAVIDLRASAQMSAAAGVLFDTIIASLNKAIDERIAEGDIPSPMFLHVLYENLLSMLAGYSVLTMDPAVRRAIADSVEARLVGLPRRVIN